eukprot:6187056-Pleurochrysis_carterae.AAC.1
MHPGRRPYPDSTHVLEEATEFAQCGCVCGARDGALYAVNRPKRFVPKQEQHPRRGDEDDAKPQNRGPCLPLLRDGHGETNPACDSVPGT